MPEPRDRYHHGDLRAALIATGLDLTRTGGPDALRLREVTRLIGVSPNAAYRHFANHQALLAAVAAEVQDRMAQSMREHTVTTDAQELGARAVARLRGVGLGYVGFAVDEPGWFRLAFFAPEGVDRPDGLMPPPLSLLHEALDALVEASVLARERRKGAEWSCWSTVHGFAELAIHGPLRDQPRQRVHGLAERAIDEIIAGILGS
ncbi:TetR/AcrR family transcriptional regulator [Nakamurella aerolata]|uniref:WHG domain-containing protein n=1 Tax=Nakamurella aerolata TaxID=1656892 RepID=A0A849ABS7_9ACTN|nr:TetR/AcrR family transcriptional regulator [Nakamurella aerolata]NNG37387.1 WHG domain-containing protein [Nakamurella aerolata]